MSTRKWNSSTSTEKFSAVPRTKASPLKSSSDRRHQSRFARLKSAAQDQHAENKQKVLLAKQHEREDRSRLAQEKLQDEQHERQKIAEYEQTKHDLHERKLTLDADDFIAQKHDNVSLVGSGTRSKNKTQGIVVTRTNHDSESVAESLSSSTARSEIISTHRHADISSSANSANSASSASSASFAQSIRRADSTPSELSPPSIRHSRSASTLPPSTHLPSTRSPSTRSPSTRSPSTRSPSTRSPSTRSPSTRSPSTRPAVSHFPDSEFLGISDTWRDDLEQHQLHYMSSLDDPGVFTAELLRTKDKMRKEKEEEKQAMINSGVVPEKVTLGDLLSLANNPLTPVVLSQVCYNLLPTSGATMCELCLDNTSMNDQMLATIAKSLEFNDCLTALSVARNMLTDKGVVSLAKVLRRSTSTALRSLGLSENPIGDRGVAALSAVLHETSLRAIDFTSVGAGDVGAKHLALALSVIRMRATTTVDGGVGVGGDVNGVAETERERRPGRGGARRLPIFPVLSYAGNELTSNGFLYFANCIVQNKSICSLYLDGNTKLGDRSGAILSDLLRCFSSLSEVSVQNIGLTRDGLSKLLQACEESDTVRTLHVGSNEIDDLQQISIMAGKYKISHLRTMNSERAMITNSTGVPAEGEVLF